MTQGFDFEAAFDRLVEELKPWAGVDRARTRTNANFNCDLWLPNVADKLMAMPGVTVARETVLQSLSDAAAEMVRIGVLRPGEAIPDGTSFSRWVGEGFSLTAVGREWISKRPAGPPRDPGKFIQSIQPFAARFGPGFLQRAQEAVGCWRTGHNVAACVMCGGASESIVLALAVAKVGGDEAAVLREYRGASGRKKIVDRLTQGTKGPLTDHLNTFVGLLGYWRDEAGHGLATTITEAEANLALLQLLRFAQFAANQWEELTK